jgi:ankyrin repeat protein
MDAQYCSVNIMFGQTTLIFAALRCPNPLVVSTLLKAGANIETKNGLGMTALMCAVLKNPNPKVMSTLLIAGADAKAKTPKAKQPLIVRSITRS